MYTSKRNQTAEKKQHSRPFTPGEEPNQLDGDGDVGGEVLIWWSLLPLPLQRGERKRQQRQALKVGERR
jgi:hypothetical protein